MEKKSNKFHHNQPEPEEGGYFSRARTGLLYRLEEFRYTYAVIGVIIGIPAIAGPKLNHATETSLEDLLKGVYLLADPNLELITKRVAKRYENRPLSRVLGRSVEEKLISVRMVKRLALKAPVYDHINLAHLINPQLFPAIELTF